MPVTMHPSNDETLTLTGAYAGGAYLNSATVTYAIKDETGTTVAGGSGSMSYTAASDGVYTVTVESTVTALLTVGGYYTYTITLVSGSYDAQWIGRVNVQRRDGS